ncbi:proprotein convertase subtilisin/kexin type 7 isoform X3 [Manis pentadactyla]|uniref:proprotein convertase subtilisin/kexin type 7 isoform X3 n=1 Tax=Manis pentadactyla TaxID=143292 RepID=UPI00255C2FFA|nr:proprotein convertase subtilisin/kexin type 7 isoform X3 [Manis pentadactyla]
MMAWSTLSRTLHPTTALRAAMTSTPTTRTLCPTRMRRMATTMARGARERSPRCPTTVSVPWEWRTGAAWQRAEQPQPPCGVVLRLLRLPVSVHQGRRFMKARNGEALPWSPISGTCRLSGRLHSSYPPAEVSVSWMAPLRTAWRPWPSTSTIRSMTSTAAAGDPMTMGGRWMAPTSLERPPCSMECWQAARASGASSWWPVATGASTATTATMTAMPTPSTRSPSVPPAAPGACAVDEEGRMPFYAEECASMLAVTFSGGDKMLRSIVTTDWDLQKGTGCTEGHTGTSAAAPLAAGMIALMLQVRPCLTWRDVQHIIVFTATQYEDHHADWATNEAGFSHSHQHGFGLLSAWRLVNAAKIWTSVPYLASYASPVLKENKAIPLSPCSLEVLWNVSRMDLEMSGLKTLEHVAVTVSITHPRRGSLELKLFCPSGMMSLIGAPRSMDSDPSGFDDWTFSTVRCWGERAQGTYRLAIRDVGDEPFQAGILRQWQLTLYGSVWTPVDIRDRQRLLESAMSGKYLDEGFTLPCPPGLKIPEEDGYTITPNTLKTLVLVGCFTVFWTIYYMLEVYLGQRNVASHPVCRSGPCHWPQRSQKAGVEETELESVPLCNSKDPAGADAEGEGAPRRAGLPVPAVREPGAWGLSQSRSAPDGPHQPLRPDLLRGREERIC